MDRKKVVEWVQKLMAKAADPAATEEERDAFQKKAEEFMVRYKVSMMEATTPEEIKNHEMIREDVKFVVPGRANWGYHLAWAIGPVFECEAIRTTGTKRMSFFGYPEDVETCVHFYRTFQMQIIFAVDATGYETVKERNSYAWGMVERIAVRMRETYVRVKEIVPAETKELIVLKEKEVRKYAEAHFGKIGKSNLKNTVDETAFINGFKDGGHLDIVDHRKKKVEEN